MRHLPLAILLVLAAACAPASAATLRVSPPVDVAAGGVDPVVAALPGGGWVLAWAGGPGNPGVYAVRRDASGAFEEVQQVSTQPAAEVQVAAGPDGRLAVAWVADRMLGFAQARPGEPLAGGELNGMDGDFGRPRVAIGADGSTFLGFQAHNSPGSTSAQLMVVPAEGPVQLAPLWSQVLNGPDLGIDAKGGVVAMWSGSVDPERISPPRVVMVQDLAPRYGEPVTVSSPSTDADNNYAPPQLAVGPRGDALVAWSPMPISHGGPVFPSGSNVAHRPAGGAWSGPEELHAAGTRPFVAVNGRGDSMVVTQTVGVVASSRPAGGAFAAEWPYRFRHGTHMHTPVALDDAGNAVVVDTATPPAPVPGVAAALRPAGGCLGDEVDVSPPGVVTGRAALGMRGDGSGLVAWAADEGGSWNVKLADLRIAPGGRERCPEAAQPQPGAKLPPTSMSVSRTPARVTRRMLRKGIAMRVRAPRGSAVGAFIVRPGRALERLARVDGKVGRRGVATLRIRLGRKLATALPRGTKLEMWIFARAPRHEVAGRIRKLTVR